MFFFFKILKIYGLPQQPNEQAAQKLSTDTWIKIIIHKKELKKSVNLV